MMSNIKRIKVEFRIVRN